MVPVPVHTRSRIGTAGSEPEPDGSEPWPSLPIIAPTFSCVTNNPKLY